MCVEVCHCFTKVILYLINAEQQRVCMLYINMQYLAAVKNIIINSMTLFWSLFSSADTNINLYADFIFYKLSESSAVRRQFMKSVDNRLQRKVQFGSNGRLHAAACILWIQILTS